MNIESARAPFIRTYGRLKYFLPVAWFITTFGTSVAVIALLIVSTMNAPKYNNETYTTFAAKPHVLGTATNEIAGASSKAVRLDKVFERYNCPITGTGEAFVHEAEKNNIPYWLVASIAFQESSCGKNTPKVDGQDSHNLWGWGVYGDKVTTFDSIEQGISTVSVYMNRRFYSQGVTDLCDIMKTYTPPSNGSWCEGVGFFKDQILNFETN